MFVRIILLCLLSAAGAGCAPSFSPLYRDFDVAPSAAQHAADASTEMRGEASAVRDSTREDADVYLQIRAALAEAGWDEAPQVAPNVVSTQPRQLSDWGLYRVLVSIDVVPLGDRHVRVLFHPVRRYFTGGRSKIPYLSSGMRQTLLPPLNDAFEEHGLYPIGTPRERDESDVEGT